MFMKTRMYNIGRQQSLGLLGAWCSSCREIRQESHFQYRTSRIVARIVLAIALAHRIVMGLFLCRFSSASHVVQMPDGLPPGLH